MHESLPIVLWSIPCFDKRGLQPLPVYNRTFVLDWSKLSPSETEEVLVILNDGDRDRGHSPKSFDSVAVTVSREPSRPDWRMLKFRRLFFEISADALAEAEERCSDGRYVRLHAEYFEDENGKSVSAYDMIRHVSGQQNPIIAGDAKSVLRLGPVPPVAVDSWSAETANAIAQFLEVITHVCSSAWYKSGHRITFENVGHASRFADPTASTLLEAIFPDARETMEVLAFFRQLHAADRLLEEAGVCYIRHCSDGRKQSWIDERVQAFKAVIDTAPRPFEPSYTRREIIRMFMYGAGMLHASAHGDDANNLADLIRSHGRHNAVMIFNNCLWDILSIAIPVFHVIRQDFEHWVSDHRLLKPSRQEIAELFQSIRG